MDKLKNFSNLILECFENYNTIQNYNKYQNTMNMILFFISIVAI